MSHVKRKQLAALILSTVGISLVLLAAGQLTSSTPREHPLGSVSPILIQRDDDFDAEHGVVGGSGTASDPYRIEGLEIDTSSKPCPRRPCAAITVSNVSASFLIRNVKIRGGQYDDGVSLSEVKNATIGSIYATVGGAAIRIASSTSLTILGNVIVESQEGISILRSNNVVLTANSISLGSQGILVQSSSRVTLLDNVLSGNHANGIIFLNCTGGIIEGNVVTATAFRAIGLFESSDIVVSHNHVVGSGEECLYVLSGHGNLLIQNEIASCQWSGISVMTSNDNILKDNSVAETPYGIGVSDSCGNIVSGNRVTNTSVALAITPSSDCNLILPNNTTTAVAGALLSPQANQAPSQSSRWTEDLAALRKWTAS
jgi:parallel beta-helix repeat protein